MTHTVTVVNDAVNYTVAVDVDGKPVLSLPYTSWWNPTGYNQGTQTALAGQIAQSLINVLNTPLAAGKSYAVTVEQNGLTKTFDVLVNGLIVASFGYSGVWLVGGAVASMTTAKNHAYQLSNSLSAVLANS